MHCICKVEKIGITRGTLVLITLSSEELGSIDIAPDENNVVLLTHNRFLDVGRAEGRGGGRRVQVLAYAVQVEATVPR